MKSTLRSLLAEFDQEYLPRFWDDLDDNARNGPRHQIEAIDRAQLARLVRGSSDAMEVNPLWALDSEEASRKIKPGLHVTQPT